MPYTDLIRRTRAAESASTPAKRRGFPTRESQAHATSERAIARRAAGKGQDINLPARRAVSRKVSR